MTIEAEYRRVGQLPLAIGESLCSSPVYRRSSAEPRRPWGEVADDYSYWREIPDAEYDRWVDRCEALDTRIESCLSGDGFIIGNITYWRERAVEITLAQLSDKRLRSLQRLLSGRFRDWRIVLQVWSDLDDGEHLGAILIGRDFFAISRGLGRHFPLAASQK